MKRRKLYSLVGRPSARGNLSLNITKLHHKIQTCTVRKGRKTVCCCQFGEREGFWVSLFPGRIFFTKGEPRAFTEFLLLKIEMQTALQLPIDCYTMAIQQLDPETGVLRRWDKIPFPFDNSAHFSGKAFAKEFIRKSNFIQVTFLNSIRSHICLVSQHISFFIKNYS